VRRDLDATGVEYRLEPTLVRGLDYYSRTTWEFVGPLENENATLSGGGRYDYLVEEIGGPPTPGVGFGAGIERLLLALEEEGARIDSSPAIDVFFALEPDARASWLARLACPAPRLGRLGRHRLRGALAQGPADPGGRLGAASTVVVDARRATIVVRRARTRT
jgi:histidyl-tRNA synthetase